MRKSTTLQILAFATATLLAFHATAQTPPKTPVVPTTPADAKSAGDVAKPQQANAKVFKELTAKLLALEVKLLASDKPGDKDRAKTIRAALDAAEKAGVDNQFRTLITGMTGPGGSQVQDLEKLIGQDEELSKALLEMLTILMTDDETARLKAEIAMLEKYIKEAEEIKRRQELLRTKTDSKKGETKDIANSQKDVAAQTKDLGNRMGGQKGGDAKKDEPKAEPKAADAKAGENASDPKADTQEIKAENKAGEPKAGDPKEGKPGAESKPGKDAKPGEAKPGDPKSGDAKAGEPKAGDDKKPDDKKPDDKKPEEKKPSDSKPSSQGKAESKPSEPKAGDGKGKPGDPKDAPPGGQSKPGGGSPPPGGQQPPPPPQNNTPGRKAVEEAYPHQKGAEDDANKDNRPDASKKMDKAIDALAKAIEEMKKRLKQLREEEMLKLLANLEARCNRMLAMQIEVYENTKAIHAGVVKNDNVKTNADIQKSQQQSDKEKEIVAEAEKALKLLETEGSAVAFATVLQEVMVDMQAVQARLEKAYVDGDTQAIEENIIAMLKDMVAALKKAQAEAGNKPPSPPGQPGKPNQKLIDLLAELKLIRALQSQVNTRTTMYGKKSETEQAADPLVQNELRQLSARQAKLQEMVQKIATGANQ